MSDFARKYRRGVSEDLCHGFCYRDGRRATSAATFHFLAAISLSVGSAELLTHVPLSSGGGRVFHETEAPDAPSRSILRRKQIRSWVFLPYQRVFSCMVLSAGPSLASPPGFFLSLLSPADAIGSAMYLAVLRKHRIFSVFLRAFAK